MVYTVSEAAAQDTYICHWNTTSCPNASSLGPPFLLMHSGSARALTNYVAHSHGALHFGLAQPCHLRVATRECTRVWKSLLPFPIPVSSLFAFQVDESKYL